MGQTKWKHGVRVAVWAATAICCGMNLGCHRKQPVLSQADQIRAVLNEFYAKEPACLWTNPVTLERSKTAPETITSKEAHALDAAGLIDIERHSYKLTNAGRVFWRADQTDPAAGRGANSRAKSAGDAQPEPGNLCFGKWRVDRIVSMTSRPDDLFGDATETEFDATIVSPALWTRLPVLQKAFPLMALEVSKPLPHSATMKHTDKGWRIAVIAVPSVH